MKSPEVALRTGTAHKAGSDGDVGTVTSPPGAKFWVKTKSIEETLNSTLLLHKYD